jgi:hypothetical protein
MGIERLHKPKPSLLLFNMNLLSSFNPNVEIRTLYFLFCQVLVIALQRTADPGGLSCLRPHLDALAALI